jgi:hypothetical protein
MSVKTQSGIFYSLAVRQTYKQLKSGKKVLGNHLLDAEYSGDEENILYS